MKNIRKIIRKIIKEQHLLEGYPWGQAAQMMLKRSQEEAEEDRIKKEKELSQKKKEALGKLEKLRSQVILDEKASKALMEYFIHDSRRVYVGMNCAIVYLRSVDGPDENYHENIFCHIMWWDRFSRYDTFYYTRESGIKPPDFGYEIGESLKE